MPLSKARDRVRKKRERARNRLEKLLCPPQILKPVQPNRTLNDYSYELDADGNPIYGT